MKYLMLTAQVSDEAYAMMQSGAMVIPNQIRARDLPGNILLTVEAKASSQEVAGFIKTALKNLVQQFADAQYWRCLYQKDVEGLGVLVANVQELRATIYDDLGVELPATLVPSNGPVAFIIGGN